MSDARVIMVEGKAWVAHAFHQRYIDEIDEQRVRFLNALVEIRDADPVDMALDPGWPARIAKAALDG